MANEDVFIMDEKLVKRLLVDAYGQIHFEISLYSDKEEIKSGISDDDDSTRMRNK
jgi:hypothetical protein